MMQAFLGDVKVKRTYLKRVREHRKADELIKGVYWDKGKGCAVGCTIHSGNHAAYETELGIPRLLARLEDGIFEALPNGHAKKWPEQFLSAIRVGADLSMVWPKFAVWLLTDEKYGVLQFAKKEGSKEAIQDVSDAYQSVVDGKAPAPDWQKLRAAAAYAADAAAAYAAAAYAAYAAAADAAAAYAAYAAAADAADAAAARGKRDELRIAQAKKLIALLKAA